MPRRDLGGDSKGPGRPQGTGSTVPSTTKFSNTSTIPVRRSSLTQADIAAHNASLYNYNRFQKRQKRGANVKFSKQNVVTGNQTGRTVYEKGVPVWSNKSVTSKKNLTFHIPFEIMKVLNALNDEYKSVEFSILGKAEKHPTKESHIVMENEFYVPTQKVSAAHIDYEEDVPDYNVVIHKHPDGCLSFSGTDDEYINANFDFSLLWVNRKFEKGHARIKTTYGYISVPIEIEIDEVPKFDLTDEIKAKIIEETPAFKYAGRSGGVIIGGGSWKDHLGEVDDYGARGGYGGQHHYSGQNPNPHSYIGTYDWGDTIQNVATPGACNQHVFGDDDIDNVGQPTITNVFDELDALEEEWNQMHGVDLIDTGLNEDGSLADFKPDSTDVDVMEHGLEALGDDELIDEVLERGFEIVIGDDDSTDIGDRGEETEEELIGSD